VEQLAELALGHGISTFILFQVESTDIIRWFAAEVVPAVREIVAADRTKPRNARLTAP
jgi:hypothetical protein